MSIIQTPPVSRALRAGSLVFIQWGAQQVRGIIKEDRGPIGVGGQTIVQH